MSGEHTPWQKSAWAEFKRIQNENPRSLRVIGKRKLDADGRLPVEIELPTAEIPHREGGAVLEASERFLILVPKHDITPLQVVTEHLRFIDVPHVLQGTRLCIYLDPSREWDPAGGTTAFLERLWAWLTDASMNSFDPSTALYHAVGGVLHEADGAPTHVLREELPPSPKLMHAVFRNDHRIDLSATSGPGAHAVAMGHSSHALPLGASRTLEGLTASLRTPLSPAAAAQPGIHHTYNIGDRLLAAAKRNPDGTPLSFVVTVAHPAGGPPHVLIGRVSAEHADILRSLPSIGGTHPNVDITWCPVSDERPSVTTRRDSARPVATLDQKALTLIGCGGLGSWVAEFAVRAGIRRIRLIDPARISGGLLVRQNFTEEDIGLNKVHALSARLRLISDNLEIIESNDLYTALVEGRDEDDIIIDTTVTRSVARYLDLIAELGPRRATIVQMATDSRTGSLGLLTIVAPNGTGTPLQVDNHARAIVEADPELEPYANLWSLSAAGQVVPTRGCSIPTFHGSAADLAAIAGSLISLLGVQLREPHSGTHLIALPHAADDVPRHLFIAAP